MDFKSIGDFLQHCILKGWSGGPVASAMLFYRDGGFILELHSGDQHWNIAVDLDLVDNFLSSQLPAFGVTLDQEDVMDQCGHMFGFWRKHGMPYEEALDFVFCSDHFGYLEMVGKYFLGNGELLEKFEVCDGAVEDKRRPEEDR